MTLYGLSAEQVARLRRMLQQGGVPPMHERGGDRKGRTVWEPRVGKATTTISAGGSTYVSVRQSTASGSTERDTGLTVFAHDWLGTGASSGDKLLLFKPWGARWYFVKPGSGGVDTNQAYWLQVQSTPTTRVGSGFGSTAANWVKGWPCNTADGQGVDNSTTYVVELPHIRGCAPTITTGEVLSYMPTTSNRVCVSDYSAPNAGWMLQNATTVVMSAHSAGYFVGIPDGAAGTHYTNMTMESSGTSTVVLVPQVPGRYLVSYAFTVTFNGTTGYYNAWVNDTTVSKSVQAGSITEIRCAIKGHSTTQGSLNATTYLVFGQTFITYLTTSDKLSVWWQTPTAGITGQIPALHGSFSGHLIHYTTHSWT